MTRRKLLSVILAVVMLSATVLFTGCKDTTVGKSNWTTNGGDPAIKKQDEVAADKLVSFGMYPQTKAAADVQKAINVRTWRAVHPISGTTVAGAIVCWTFENAAAARKLRQQIDNNSRSYGGGSGAPRQQTTKGQIVITGDDDDL